jgi:hypothetical protein
MNFLLRLGTLILLLSPFFYGCADSPREKTTKEFNGLSGPPKTEHDTGFLMFENRGDLNAGIAFDLIESASGRVDYAIATMGKYVVSHVAVSNDNKYVVIECKIRGN